MRARAAIAFERSARVSLLTIPIRTTSRAVTGNDLFTCTFCGTYPMALDAFLGGFPSTSIVPFWGVRSPSISLSSVVFPPPFGPMTATKSPYGMLKFISLRTASFSNGNHNHLFQLWPYVYPYFNASLNLFATL
jgi:hypothetical protein